MSEEEGWRLEFWRDSRGRAPVQEFIEGFDRHMRDKVERTITLLQASGTRLGMPLARPVAGQRFWELRVQTGGNTVRVFYFFFTGRRIVLLHGFMKKDRKTPMVELATAARRLGDYTGGTR